jgi:hypothetical protein
MSPAIIPGCRPPKSPRNPDAQHPAVHFVNVFCQFVTPFWNRSAYHRLDDSAEFIFGQQVSLKIALDLSELFPAGCGFTRM